ncbi:MAG: hypothetical protein AB1405_04415 [Bdellovibrionota bacterium]
MSDLPRHSFSLPGHLQALWILGFIVALLSGAFFLSWTGIAAQGGKWFLFAFMLAGLGGSAYSLYWLATLVKTVVLNEKSLLLDSAAIEREVEFEEIDKVILVPRGKKWRVVILCKAGGGYQVPARTREWAEMLSARAKVPLEEATA